MKQQIIVIGGGNTFETYKEYLSYLKKQRIDFERYRTEQNGWKKTLEKKLGRKFEVILIDMPNKANAKYAEWKIWFEKFIPHIKPKAIFIGHSLGGIFIAKYLAENKLVKKILAVFLIAAPYEPEDASDSLADFVLPRKLDKLEAQTENIFIYQSKDDPVVLFINSEKYRKNLKNPINRIFINKGHFNQENFPELIEDIKNL